MVPVVLGDVTGRAKLLDRARVGHGREPGDRTTPVGHLERLPCLDQPQVLAGPLSKLAYSDAPHSAT